MVVRRFKRLFGRRGKNKNRSPDAWKKRSRFLLPPVRISASGTVSSPLGTLLLRSIIIPGVKTTEGRIIEAISLPWFDIIELLEKDPSIAFQISDRKWEELVAGAYKKAGFDSVTLTPRSGDLGRDVIAEKRGIGIVRVIDQVKAYKPSLLVTANDVRALMGVLQTDGASKGFVTTTSDFAPKLREDPLIAPFIPSRLELINGAQLREGLIKISKGE
jgi:restriction system protein